MSAMNVSRNYHVLFGLVLLTILAAGLRLPRLGAIDTKGDEVGMWQELQGGMTAATSWSAAWRDFGATLQMPLPHAGSCFIVRGLKLKNDLFATRLPFALMGILTVSALWWLGHSLGSERLGWIMAFLGAINPYSIYWSRTGHVYEYVLLTATLAYAALAAMIRTLHANGRVNGIQASVAALCSILAAYSHMSTWMPLGLLWLLAFGLIVRRHPRQNWIGHYWQVWLAFLVWIATIIPWACLFLDTRILHKPADAGLISNDFSMLFATLYQLPFVYTWGGGLPRAIITVGLLGFGIYEAIRNCAWRRIFGVMLVVALVPSVINGCFMARGGNQFNIRYFSPFWPLAIFLSALGISGLAHLLSAVRVRFKLHATALVVALCAIVAISTAGPIVWLLMLPGNPVPFSKINQWLDAHLPHGTPVIIDGMWRVLIEMRPHAATNVYLTFTVPDVGLEMWLKNNWRGSVKEFVTRFPDAAVVETGKAYYREPGVGPWLWVREHFRRRIAITNEQAWALRETILAPIPDYYGLDTNSIVTEIFYNLPEDIVDLAKKSGKTAIMLWGQDWGYVKTRDYRDWRVLGPHAVLDAYNLTAEARSVSIVIKGCAIGGAKMVQADTGAQQMFKNQELIEWRIGPMQLNPGRTPIELRDPKWKLAQVPLLVERIDIQ